MRNDLHVVSLPRTTRGFGLFWWVTDQHISQELRKTECNYRSDGIELRALFSAYTKRLHPVAHFQHTPEVILSLQI